MKMIIQASLEIRRASELTEHEQQALVSYFAHGWPTSYRVEVLTQQKDQVHIHWYEGIQLVYDFADTLERMCRQAQALIAPDLGYILVFYMVPEEKEEQEG